MRKNKFIIEKSRSFPPCHCDGSGHNQGHYIWSKKCLFKYPRMDYVSAYPVSNYAPYNVLAKATITRYEYAHPERCNNGCMIYRSDF